MVIVSDAKGGDREGDGVERKNKRKELITEDRDS